VVLLIVWAIGSFAIARLIRTRPGWAAAVPVAEAVFWFAFVSAGGALLGWTA
jgi:hypothetical protein